MMDQEIVDYISQAQKHGLSDFEIKQNLANAGWEAEVIEQSFVYSKAAENKPAAAKEPAGFGLKNFQNTVTVQAKPAPNSESRLSSGAAEKPSNKTGNFFKKPLLWIVLVVLLFGAGGAYGYYNYVYMTPARVWANYLGSKKPATDQQQYTITYSGGESASGSPVTLSLSGNTSLDNSNPSGLKTASDNTLNFQYGSLNYSAEIKDVTMGQVIYAELGALPIFQTLTGNQNIDWVKFDIAELQSYLNQNSTGTLPQLLGNPANQTQLKSKLLQIWAQSNFAEPDNFIARENLDNVPVYHLKIQINRQALDSAVLNSVNAVRQLQGSGAASLTGQEKTQITALVNRFQIQNFEVWLGRSDSQLYKISLGLSAPSAQDFASGSMAASFLPSQEQSRDAKRLADVRQIQSALELYHNDFGGYPAAATGSPENLVPYYMPTAAAAPEPADGSCTDYFNGYWYKVSGTPRTVKGQVIYPSFTLTFCLGTDIGGFKAGIGELSPSGIAGNITCPATADKCVSNGQQQSQEFLDAVNKMDFTGQLGISITYSYPGKPQSIVPPPTSTDILDLIKGAALAPASSTTQSLQ